MTIILGLDVATRTGGAIYDTTKGLSAIQAFHLDATGERDEDKAGDLGRQLMERLRKRENRPDFAVIERPLQNVVMFNKKNRDLAGDAPVQTHSAPTLVNQLAGAIFAVLSCYRIPYCTVTASQWRKGFLGKGVDRSMDRKAWKKASREQCKKLQIIVKNDDQADAVGIAFSAPAQPLYRWLYK